jgi:CO/xanthine dehydrogenase Mo-binding subunit
MDMLAEKLGMDPFEFRLRNANSRNESKITQLWSNLSTNPRRIRVEVVYLKL